MTDIDNIVLITFGVLEKRDGKYFGKHQVVHYAEEFSEYFDNVLFVCHRSYSNEYSTELDLDKVIPRFTGIVLREEGRTLEKTELIKLYLDLIMKIDSNTGVILNSPSILFTPILPVISYRAGHFSTYFGADYKEVANIQRENRGVSGFISSSLTIIQAKYSSLQSDSKLVRGNDSSYENSDNIFESKPIIDLSERDNNLGTDAIQENPIKVLYVGSLQFRKGIDNLIRSIKTLNERDGDKDYELIIVGEGAERERLEDLVNQLGLNTLVEFTGWIDSGDLLAEYFSQSAVLVVPSRKAEGQPRVIDEAQYYGTPVLATDLNYGEDLKHKHNIYFIDKSKPDNISDGIYELTNNENIYTEIQEKGEERVDAISNQSAASQHAKIILEENSNYLESI